MTKEDDRPIVLPFSTAPVIGQPKWETVTVGNVMGAVDHTDRLKVPGGYLYRNLLAIPKVGVTVTVKFVPDPGV